MCGIRYANPERRYVSPFNERPNNVCRVDFYMRLSVNSLNPSSVYLCSSTSTSAFIHVFLLRKNRRRGEVPLSHAVHPPIWTIRGLLLFILFSIIIELYNFILTFESIENGRVWLILKFDVLSVSEGKISHC